MYTLFQHNTTIAIIFFGEDIMKKFKEHCLTKRIFQVFSNYCHSKYLYKFKIFQGGFSPLTSHCMPVL